jgi:O-antigen/teichoic acid export membrane protein
LLLATFIVGGFTETLIQRAELRKDHFDTAFWLVLGFGALAAILLVSGTPLVAWFFSQPELNAILPVLALSLPFTSVSATYQSMLQRELRFRQLATRSMVAYTTGFVAAVVMAKAGMGIWSLVASYLVSRVLDAVLIVLVAKLRPGFGVTRAALTDIVDYGKHRVGSQLVAFIISQVDRVVVGALLGPVALGLYSIAERIITAFTNGISGVFIRVAFPVLSAQQFDRPAFDRSVRQFIMAASVFAQPIFLGLAVTAYDVFAVVLSESWSSGAPILQIMCLAAIIHPVTWVLTVSTNALGHARTMLRVGLVALVFRIAASIAGAQISVIAVAVGHWIVVVIIVVVIMAFTNRFFGGRWLYIFGGLKAPAMATTLMVAATLLAGTVVTDATPLVSLGIKAAVGVAAYALALRMVAPELYRSALALVTFRT